MAKEDNLTPVRTEDEARELGRRGGIASGEARRRRKTLAETLRAELEKPVGEGSTMTKQEYLVARCITGLKDKLSPKDLKTLSEVLGESTMRLDMDNARVVVVRSQEEAEKLANIGNIGA